MDDSIKEAVIMALLAHRIPANQICKYVGISHKSFVENYSYLDDFEYSIDRNEAVENAIFAAALSGNAPSMIAWLKNKAQWDEGRSAAAQNEVTRHVPVDKIQIQVISNKEVASDERKEDSDPLSDSDGTSS